jgi:nucleoside-diphosphate-sugar epimerase
MNIFVTGSTGYIGKKLSMKLAREGFIVHALYRDITKTKGLEHENIKLYRGDILDKDSLLNGMKNCTGVFHTAAFTSIWTRNPSTIETLNVNGTVNVLKTALELSVEKFVYTSTAGVFGPSGRLMTDEKSPFPSSFFTHYEKTKAHIEQIIIPEFLNKGLNVVIVNPTRVYGPGPLNDANSVSKIIKRHLEGKIGLVPSDGKSIGNYVYVDDVVEGQILAMKKGKTGARYILGGENIAFIDLMKLIATESGQKSRLVKIPVFIMSFLSWIFLISAEISGIKPMITQGLIKKFLPDWRVSSEKAKKELEYNPVNLEYGIKKTIEWLTKEYQM